jgi:protein-S-isoprenylcysteine O-methyltransferase Ste14
VVLRGHLAAIDRRALYAPPSQLSRLAVRGSAVYWKPSNIPIPEAHVVALMAGLVLHLFAPLWVFSVSWADHALGWPLVMAGLLVAAWAVWAVEGMDVRLPTHIIYPGPYASSRNPMYVGWTLISVGLALAANSPWPILFRLSALIYTHVFAVRREERDLERRFGDEQLRYRDNLRRYL